MATTAAGAADEDAKKQAHDDAAVGSISHILRTLFRGLYEESEAPEEEAPGPAPAEAPACITDEASVASLRMELQTEPWFDPKQRGDPEATKALARKRALSIAKRLETQRTQADDLLQYMKVQTTKAKREDKDEEISLKKIGLIQNAHLPQHRSTLELHKGDMDQSGKFADALVTAEDLVEANRRDVAIQSGNYAQAGLTMPGPPLLEEDEPAYYKQTASFSKRCSKLLPISHGPNGGKATAEFVKTFLATTKSQGPALEEKVKQARKKRVDQMTGDEEWANDTILRGMRARQHFLRNPRYDPSSSNHNTRLTVRPPSPRMIGKDVYVEGDPMTIAFDATYAASQRTFEKTQAAVESHDLIAVEPASLFFRNHVPAQIYEQTLHIRNTSAISRRLRLLRPQSRYFKVARVKWPGGEDSGVLAPGMSVHALIKFAPDSLKDFEDRLVVVSEEGEVNISLTGKRDPPILDLPSVLDVGACLLGGVIEKTFRVTNSGGPGAFRLLDVCDRDVPEHLITYQEVRTGAFVVGPARFSLDTDQSMDVHVTFKPEEGRPSYDASFLLIDEEQHATTYSLKGRAEAIQVRVAGLDGVDLDSHGDYKPPSTLNFDSVCLGSSSVHALDLVNDGELSLSYEVRIDGASSFTYANGDGTIHSEQRSNVAVTYAPSANEASQAILRIMIKQIPRQAAGITSDEDVVDIEVYSCVLRGRGHLARLEIAPGAVAFPRAMYLGESVASNAVTVTNPTDSTVAWAFDDDQRITVDGSLVQDAPQASLVWLPSGGVLEPGQSVDTVATATGLEVGSYDVSCGLDIADQLSGETHEAGRVVVRGEVVQARIKFEVPEVDLGLIAVGGRKDYELKFTNTAPCGVDVEFQEVKDHLEAVVDDDDSVDEGATATVADTFVIDHDACALEFDPPLLRVPAKSQGSILVRCAAGKRPERLRSVVTCACNRAPPQYMSIRGEVQAPKVYLKETSVPLGVVYVGVPVERELTLVNLSNLSTKFKFERPGGSSPAFTLVFEPRSGELEAKQVLTISIKYTALTAGVVDEVLGCKVFGCALPLGFGLRATSKNAVLAYELLGEDQAPPPPLCDSNCVQLPDDVQLPLVPPLPSLNFGTDVPLFERRKMRIAVRNLSAIAAPFNFGCSKYAAEPLPPEKPRFANKILDDAHDVENTFQSEMGRTYVSKRLLQKQDAIVLKKGNGVAFAVEPSTGQLTPWGVTVVTVTAFNNMASLFNDTLSCEVETAPTASIPVSLAVIGCPLTFKQECAGLDLTLTKCKDPLLRFGQVTIGHPSPPEKHIKIRNDGPVDARISWRLVREGLENAERQFVECKLMATEDGVSTSIEWKEPEVYESPFTIKPISRVVKAHAEATFTMILPSESATGLPGRIASVAVADAEWVSKLQVSSHDSVEGETAKLTSLGALHVQQSMKSKLLKARKAPKVTAALKVCLDARIVEPSLRMEKASKDSNIRFRTWSTVEVPPVTLVKHAPKSLHRKTLLRNPLDVPVSCSLSLDGPFSLLRCFSTEFSYLGADCTSTIKLLPAQSMGVDILFEKPPLPVRIGDKPLPLEHLYRGDLNITFSTGQLQTIALKATVLSPTLVVQPAAHAFGVVRADKTSELLVFLSNPTEVEASWSLRHVPRAGRKNDGIDGDNARPDSVDDPSVFAFEHVAGVVAGPSLPLRSAAACVPKDFMRDARPLFAQTLTELSWKGAAVTSLAQSLTNDAAANPRAPKPVRVTFSPKRNVRYCSRFRFDVHHGESFDVVLQGAGSYEEDVLPRHVRVAGRNR
ncbi:unnamed protein product [Pelagomonas calceolata]|uniref:Deleted in lung and esophageal cancer protein 1 Ig-like domain-containing protein n=1 Tax=Pelagomonas calceolata TaxID=35677 RepID=A0A7S3ZMC5_9STRA|nr:unnamed protein product [Pelagomonas calceolata]|mmetsp:Transcript_11039/g.32653  ORF Transcript_11039/g.32653 Transcript_11039/m.32653 type:complete len:1780 (-) Transcript_11039:9-5348(-)